MYKMWRKKESEDMNIYGHKKHIQEIKIKLKDKKLPDHRRKKLERLKSMHEHIIKVIRKNRSKEKK